MPIRVLDEVGKGNNVDLIEAIDHARANGAHRQPQPVELELLGCPAGRHRRPR